MDAPKCRLCGKSHWSGAGCESGKPAKKKEPKSQKKATNICPTCGTDLSKRAARRKYMRDYMRERRK